MSTLPSDAILEASSQPESGSEPTAAREEPAGFLRRAWRGLWTLLYGSIGLLAGLAEHLGNVHVDVSTFKNAGARNYRQGEARPDRDVAYLACIDHGNSLSG